MSRCGNCKYFLSDGVDYKNKKMCYLKLKAQREPYTKEQALKVFVKENYKCKEFILKEGNKDAERATEL